MPHQTSGNSAQISLISRFKDNAFCSTTNHVGTHITDIIQFYHTPTAVLLSPDFRQFLNRFWFSGQWCLTDEQVFWLDNADISRNHISGSQIDNVSGNKFCNIQLFFLSSRSFYQTRILYHFHQRVGGFACSPLLPETQNGTEHDHRRNNDDTRPLLLSRWSHEYIQNQGYNSQSGENSDKRIYKCLDKQNKGILSLLVNYFILSIGGLTLFHFSFCQPEPSGLQIWIDRFARLGSNQKNFFWIEWVLRLAQFLLPHHNLLFLKLRIAFFQSRCKGKDSSTGKLLEIY